MKKSSARLKLINNICNKKKYYEIKEAIEILQKFPAKFKESIDIAIKLGIDPKKSDQIVRGSTILPYGTGKNIKVAAFVQESDMEKARSAGADFFDLKVLSKEIKNNNINFNIAIATPDAMKLIIDLAPILGPKGLMPNPKFNTVTKNIELAIKQAKSGQIFFKNDKNGNIHNIIGNIDYNFLKIQRNIENLVLEIKKLKPKTIKSTYIKNITISSTMGPGLMLDINSISV